MSTNREDEGRPLMSNVESEPLLNDERQFRDPFQRSTAHTAKYILLVTAGSGFAFYGLNSILAIYLNENLGYSEGVSVVISSAAGLLNYGFALVGGVLADTKLGHMKEITLGYIIFTISLIVLFLSRILKLIHIDIVIPLTFVGLSLFVFGNGIAKPSLSSLLGDQFQPHEDKLRSSYFSWFYMFIQFGSIVSSIGVPILLQETAVWIPFAVTAASMVITLPVFLIPANEYNKVPPEGKTFSTAFGVLKEGLVGSRQPGDRHWLDKAKVVYDHQTVEDVKQSLTVLKVFIPLPLFWAIFFQGNNLWVFQAQDMDRHMSFGSKSFEIPASEVSAINPIMDIALIPLFAKGLYPLMTKIGLPLTDLKKMGLGLVCTFLSLVVTGFVELEMENHNVSVFWIVPQYFLISCGEIFLSVTAYEFAYTQAPKNMKGMLTACWLATLAAGNGIVLIIGLLNIHAKAIQSFALAGLLVLVFFLFLYIANGYKYTNQQKSGSVNDSA